MGKMAVRLRISRPQIVERGAHATNGCCMGTDKVCQKPHYATMIR
jgi:hypothetical protein